MPSRSIAHRQSAPRRYRMTAGYRLFLGLPFNLWAIVYLYLTSDNLPYEKIGDEVRSLADEVPFDIPDSWEWVRLIDVCEYIQRGKSPKYSPIKKYPVIAQKCNQWSGFSIEKAQFIEPDSLSSYGPERLLQDNDLMWNSTGLGTLGRMAIYKTVANPYELAVADSHVTIIRPLKQFVLPEYLYYYFANPTVQSVIEDQADGTTKQKELATSTIKAYLTPIPPLDEQRRILTKLSEVLPVVKSYGAVYSHFLGYRKGENGLPEIVPEEAETVRWIYSLFLSGKTTCSIASLLTREGIPTPAGKKKWAASTVESILKMKSIRVTPFCKRRSRWIFSPRNRRKTRARCRSIMWRTATQLSSTPPSGSWCSGNWSAGSP